MKCYKCIHSDVCYKYLDVMDDRYSPSYVEHCVDFKEENLQPNIYRIVVIYKDEINMHNYKELADKNGGKLFTSRHHAHYINDYIRIDFVPLSQTCRGLRAHEILIDSGSYDRIDIEDVDIIEAEKNDGIDDFMGQGRWTRGNAELCLLCTKGSPKRMSAKVRQIIYSPIREHSRKPDETRERMVELLGDVPRIELFARQTFDGWDCWGNEI